MSLTIKLSNGTTKSVDVEDFGITAMELKQKMADTVEIPAEQQRVVFKGKILKDGDVLSKMGIEGGNAIHVVKGPKPAGSAPTPAPATTSTPAPTPTTEVQSTTAPAPQQAANPYASLFGGAPPAQQQPATGAAPQQPAMNPAGMAGWGGLGMGGMGAGGMGAGMGGAGGMNDPMMQAMMQDPQTQQMVMQMMQNPQVMQQAMAMNPQFQGMTQQQREQMATMMSNPAMVQQTMNMLQGGGMGGMGGMGQQPAGGAQPAPAAGAAGGAGFNPFMFQQPQQAANPRETYANQLEQLKAMGFPNEEANVAALQQTQGSVEFAIERLLNA